MIDNIEKKLSKDDLETILMKIRKKNLRKKLSQNTTSNNYFKILIKTTFELRFFIFEHY
jgi:hypothetical protein